MTESTRKHDSRTLQTSEVVDLIKHPGSDWAVQSYHWSWFEWQHLGPGGIPLGPSAVGWMTFHAGDLGWEDRKLDTEDEAYAFVEDHIRSGRALTGKQAAATAIKNE